VNGIGVFEPVNTEINGKKGPGSRKIYADGDAHISLNKSQLKHGDAISIDAMWYGEIDGLPAVVHSLHNYFVYQGVRSICRKNPNLVTL
jgi:hypothetical protein